LRSKPEWGSTGGSRRFAAVGADEAHVESGHAFCKPTVKRGKDRFADRSALFQDFMTPEPKDRIALFAHEIIASAVVFASGVLGTIEFDDEPFFPARKISEVGADRELPSEFVAAQFSTLQIEPQQRLGLIVASAELSCACRGAWSATTSRLTSAFPHSVVASRRHLSPLRG